MLPKDYVPKTSDQLRLLNPHEGFGWSSSKRITIPAGSKCVLDSPQDGKIYCVEADTVDDVVELQVPIEDLEFVKRF